MRIGATVLLIDGQCYQSYSWSKMRPLGRLEHVVEMLEEYQCDEISIIRPVRDDDSLSSLEKDLNVLKNINTMTPLSFGGGLRCEESLLMLGDSPVERLVFSSAFLNDDEKLIKHAVDLFGHQAIQCLLPCKKEDDRLMIYACDKNEFISSENVDFDFIDKWANEIIYHDVLNEGLNNTFDFTLLNNSIFHNSRIIISGGIGYDSIKIAKKKSLASVLIDNKILHKECSIKGYKNA